MAQLAIKGHAKRGKEVIEILEMLGGVNQYEISDAKENLLYTIRSHDKFIIGVYPTNTFVVFTLEEFLEKFPYKVGDKVQSKGATSCGSIYEVEKMRWEGDTVKYTIHLFGCNYKSSTLPSEYLQPYKEETMEPIIKMNPLEMSEAQCIIPIPKGYEFAGVDDDNQQVIFEKINFQYPKTYEECCDVLSRFTEYDLNKKRELLLNVNKLIKCRDAYWKIAGEQMGLGKPWEQDYNDRCFIIANNNGNIHTYEYHGSNNVILAFPTAEMRDTFLENFKDLIIECKELL